VSASSSIRQRGAGFVRWCVFASLALSAGAGVRAQVIPGAKPARADSAAVHDTGAVRNDTSADSVSPSGIDSLVTYSASDSIVYSLASRTMYLFGAGDIRYKELGLKAQTIDINWSNSMLNAEGIVDTADTSGRKLAGQPELIDGAETYRGERIVYNFKSKKGKIDLGKTEIEKGLYYGEAIKKVEQDVLFVENGTFTTCDLEHPHYYFGSPTMKVIVKDKIIARPIFLYIADVPVFALPFGIFPSERGRRSGLIAPAFGESGRGRYLTHLGYYWAMSDYMDLALKADGYSKGSYVLYADYRYALRYTFLGGISGSYGHSVEGEPGDPAYRVENVFNVHGYHNQDFDPTTRLLVDFTFSSGSYYQKTSNNLNDLLLQNIVSNATLTKFWEGTPNSMTINIRRDQNLQSGQTNTILPGISFNRSQSFPFRSSKRSGAGGAQRWYELIGYSYGGQFLDVQNKTPVPAAPGDFTFDERRGIVHQVTVNASPKLGYVTFTPFLNYTEKWYDHRTEQGIDPATRQLTVRQVSGVKALRYYDFGLSAQTKFFGIVQPNILGIKGIRHQVTPSVSYTYQPDFSEERHGYYGSYVDTSGIRQRYGLYDSEVFGGVPAGRRQALSFNLGNVFEMKTASGDSAGEDNKFQLLNLNAGVSYNFAADSLRFSEIGMDFRTSVGQILSIGGSSRFNLYKFETDPANPRFGRRVNKFLVKESGRLADLTSFAVSIGTRLSGEKKQTTAGPQKSAADSAAARPKSGYVGLYDQEAPDFSIPWNLDLNYSFSRNQADPNNTFISSGISASLGFNLTEFWKITATTGYDLINRVFTAPQITVYRDLHCWELNFNWVPTGPYRNFRVEIRLKAPQLQDIKITKQGSVREIY
jgi:lipopolysaccharide assembly outer membrane protein LptD (OstA)